MNTPDKATQIKGAITAVLSFLTALWGWVGWAILIWASCIVLDYISGSAAARRNGEWSSEVARDGLWHKLGEIFAVLVAALCDIALGVVLKSAPFALPFEFTTLLTPIVLLWYIITELGSILENAGKLGAPLPKWLKKMLAQYKDTLDAAQGGSEDQPEPELTTPLSNDGEVVAHCNIEENAQLIAAILDADSDNKHYKEPEQPEPEK